VSRGASPFTNREAQILQAIASGLACRDIARALSISEFTVRKHRSNMLGKLDLRNAAQLVSHARDQGWLTPAPGPPSRCAFGT
jgi:DNA-binding NarL/FixJ family response regulator